MNFSKLEGVLINLKWEEKIEKSLIDPPTIRDWRVDDFVWKFSLLFIFDLILSSVFT